MNAEPAPKNQEEFLVRFYRNHKIDGFGADVTNTYPCPFCAAPNWLCAKVLETEQKITEDTKCGECGRSAKTLFHRSAVGVTFEIVQTGGDDLPAWFQPKPRRLEVAA